MGTVLTATAVVVLLGLVTTVLLVLRTRRRTALVVGALTVVALTGLEVIPRVLGERDLRSACFDGPVHAAVVGGPVTWQAITGGLRVRASVAAEDVEQIVLDRVGEMPLEDVSVELAEGEVDISASVAGPFGDLPILIAVAPRVDEGTVRFEPVAVEVAGRELPVGAPGWVGGLAGDSGGVCDGGLGSGFGSGSVDVVDAKVDSDGLSLTARL